MRAVSYLVNLAREERLALVVGGGEVAVRKIEDLLAAGMDGYVGKPARSGEIRQAIMDVLASHGGESRPEMAQGLP